MLINLQKNISKNGKKNSEEYEHVLASHRS